MKTVEQKAKDVLFNFQRELSVKARLLYVALLMVEKDRILKQADLQEIMDIKNVMTIRAAIDELKKHNLIRVTRKSYGSIYDVL